MGMYSGADLRQLFSELGIHTGNVSDSTIDSWFDTDCQDTLNLLNWICANITTDNVLTPQETREYEQALKSNTLLTGKQYEAKLNQLKREYPDILNYEANKLESERLENELTTLLEKEQSLERQANLNESVGKIISRELSEKKEEELALSIERKASEAKCLELSNELDEVNKKLQQQIGRYAENLNEYDCHTKPMFLSSFSLANYDQYYLNVQAYIDLLLKSDNRIFPNTPFKSAQKKLLTNNEGHSSYLDELETIGERIFQSLYEFSCKEIEKNVLKAQIQFLENIDSQTLSKDESFSLESSLVPKRESVKILYMDLEKACEDTSNSIIAKPKCSILVNSIGVKQQKLDRLQKVNHTVTKILSSIILLHQLLEIEKYDIQSTNFFFKDIQHYINNLQNCKLRIKSMYEVIQSYNTYKNLSLDDKLEFATVIKTIFTDKTEDVLVVDVVKQLDREYAQLEHELFLKDDTVYQQYCQLLNNDLNVVRSFLMGGPTSYIITFPQQILNTFTRVFDILNTQNADFERTFKLSREAKNKLTKDKWLKMKRLLPMWFLLKPQKMILAIQDIQAEVAKQQNKTIK